MLGWFFIWREETPSQNSMSHELFFISNWQAKSAVHKKYLHRLEICLGKKAFSKQKFLKFFLSSNNINLTSTATSKYEIGIFH